MIGARPPPSLARTLKLSETPKGKLWASSLVTALLSRCVCVCVCLTVCLSVCLSVPKGMALELFFVSARTIKRHHDHLWVNHY